ncbi:site-specific integrase [Knoellia locipacati]|uniref:Site-specific integrase n=1 Tax=Knoellia locipacati TaxID=882824 RepID=A0A512T4I4_9MICO|nr:site-specific integrase [Knoellia locipacati]GEQ15136.1 site-specific integrase [Knoellia locipacati]
MSAGSIYRRTKVDGSPGRWHAVIDLPPRPDGQRRQKTSTHDTRRQAQAWLAKTSEEVRTADLPDDTITVGVFLSQWLEGKRGLRPSTKVEYQRHLDQVFIPELGRLKLVDLRSRHIEEVLERLQKAQEARRQPISAQTFRRIHATLHSALSTAEKRGLIRRNPATTVELPKPVRYRAKIWTREEADRFLRTTKNDPHGLLFRLMLITGMRRGEAIGLQWGDVNASDSSVHIQRAITLVAGEVLIGLPKSEAGIRVVFLDATTADQLSKLQRRALLEHDWTSSMDLDDTFIFTTTRGPLHPAYVSRRFTTLCKQADVPKIRLHDLRGTSASLGLTAGEPLLQVSRRLGHSSITVTADTYSQVIPEVAKQAASTLSDTITGT